MTYDEIRAMYTVYIERVVDFARKEYLRTLSYRAKEISLDDLSEDNLPRADEPSLASEFAFEEGKLSRTLNEMPLRRRQVLILAFIDKLPAQEISERLGCAVSYVYKQKCLALQKLKATKEGDDREP